MIYTYHKINPWDLIAWNKPFRSFHTRNMTQIITSSWLVLCVLLCFGKADCVYQRSNCKILCGPILIYIERKCNYSSERHLTDYLYKYEFLWNAKRTSTSQFMVTTLENSSKTVSVTITSIYLRRQECRINVGLPNGSNSNLYSWKVDAVYQDHGHHGIFISLFSPLPHIIHSLYFILRPSPNSKKPQTTTEMRPINPFAYNDTFWRPWETSLLKTLWVKEKLLVMSNFSFTHSVFYPFRELLATFMKFTIVVCRLFQFGPV